MNNDDLELLDMVDQNDIKIDTLERAAIGSLAAGGNRYVRTACAFIRNTTGKYWIPRRTPYKKIAPNGLDFAMAVHIGAGESYIDAAVRGFKEELNILIDNNDLRMVGILGPRLGLPYFNALYIYETTTAPIYNLDDFVSAEWLSALDIIDRIKRGEPAKDNLVPAIKFLLLQEDSL